MWPRFGTRIEDRFYFVSVQVQANSKDTHVCVYVLGWVLARQAYTTYKNKNFL